MAGARVPGARQIGGERIVQQVGERRFRPEAGERGLDWCHGMFQGVDQGDAHRCSLAGPAELLKRQAWC